MNLHDTMKADIAVVFLNAEEFAQPITFDGVSLMAIVDDSHESIALGGRSAFTDASGLGLLEGARILRMAVADLPVLPVPEQEVVIDGERWLVASDTTAVKVEEGMVTVKLMRAYA